MTKWNIALSPSTQSQASSIQSLPIPFGYQLSTTVPAVQSPKKKQILDNKLYQLATSPKMQLFMAFILMFFLIGNTVTIYSILAVFQSLFNSISCILKTNKTFQPYQNMSKNLLKYKLIYIGINLIIFGVVLYKLSKMGLLSFSSSAYIDMIPPYVGKQVIASYD